MKRIFFVIIIFSVNHLYSIDFSFKLSPLIGFSFSNVNEFVYNNNVKSSQLEWKNYKPLIGIDADCSINNIILDFKVQSSIPVALGNVTDKDFFETEAISMYSYHNLVTDKDYSFEVNLFYKFIFSFFSMGLGLSGIYSNIKMEATDGYLQYPSENNEWTENISKDYLNGTIMSYEQSRSMAGLSFFIEKEINYFSFALTGYFYPLIRIDSIDNHFLRSIQFIDSMKKGFSFKIKQNINWKINEKYCLSFNADFNYLEAKGNTCINPLGIITHDTVELDKTSNIATTSYYDLVFTLGFVIKV